jgi:acyl carrier protein phosphodiesterase
LNHLAHIFLSGDDNEIVLGNFIGDFVKGHQWQNFPPGIQKGILLHRRIDDFTDHHLQVREAKKIFLSSYHPYSGVIIDVLFDGLLAKHFTEYSKTDLNTFTAKFYAMAKAASSQLPEPARHMLTYMARDNWLFNYREDKGLDFALRGLTKRTGNLVPMYLAMKEYRAHYDLLENCFRQFFPELITFTKKELENFTHDF